MTIFLGKGIVSLESLEANAGGPVSLTSASALH